MEEKPMYKITVLGGTGVGKTALIIRLLSQTFIKTHDRTIEDWYVISAVVDGQICSLHILDSAGSDTYTQLDDQWLQGAQGLVLVYSISSRPSFIQIQNLIERRIRILVSSTCTDPPPAAVAPVMLVGSQCDKDREVSMEEGRKLAENWGYGFVEASAKGPKNVDTAFHNVVRQLRLREVMGGKRPHSESGEFSVSTAESDMGCTDFGA